MRCRRKIFFGGTWSRISSRSSTVLMTVSAALISLMVLLSGLGSGAGSVVAATSSVGEGSMMLAVLALCVFVVGKKVTRKFRG